MPGLPGVTLGRSERVAWGFTNLYADVEDLYRETIVDGKAKRGPGWETVREREEMIPVRGAASERLIVRETSHGPLVSGNLALKWVALDPANLRLPSTKVMQAVDSAGVKSALDEFLEPAQNVVWADAAGGIGWRATGLVPMRRPGTDGSVPYDGSDASNDWRGFVPQSEMPRAENPAEGFLATANQRVAGTSWPHALSSDWPSPARARRIASLLEAATREGRKLDRAAVEAIQLDTASPVLAATMEALAPLLPAEWAARFRGWDGRADAASARFLVARTFRRKLGERVLAAWRIPPEIGLGEYRILELARADDAAFRRAGLGAKAALVGRAFDETLADLSARNGKDPARSRWGEANRLAVRHPLGRVPGLSWLFDPPSFPAVGRNRSRAGRLRHVRAVHAFHRGLGSAGRGDARDSLRRLRARGLAASLRPAPVLARRRSVGPFDTPFAARAREGGSDALRFALFAVAALAVSPAPVPPRSPALTVTASSAKPLAGRHRRDHGQERAAAGRARARRRRHPLSARARGGRHRLPRPLRAGPRGIDRRAPRLLRDSRRRDVARLVLSRGLGPLPDPAPLGRSALRGGAGRGARAREGRSGPRGGGVPPRFGRPPLDVVRAASSRRARPATSARAASTTETTQSFHAGLDLAAAEGTPVAAAGDGRVVLAGDLYFSGGTVLLDHGAGLFTQYFHLSRIDVKEGDAVVKGERLGASGHTGRVTGPHLHWGARLHGARVNPEDLLDASRLAPSSRGRGSLN